MRHDSEDEFVLGRLVQLLTQQGRVEEAITMLQRRADADDSMAAGLLVDLLVEQGRINELQDEVAAGTPKAAERLNVLRTERPMSRALGGG